MKCKGKWGANSEVLLLYVVVVVEAIDGCSIGV